MKRYLSALAAGCVLLVACNTANRAGLSPSPQPTEPTTAHASVTPPAHSPSCPRITKRESHEALNNLKSGWTRLTAPPFATARAVSLWVDSALFYWGGDSGFGGTVHDDGALYEPARDKWHRLPPPPIDGRSSAAGVWTGKEVVIWGGGGAQRNSLDDGAAFNPRTCAWRQIAPSPLSPRDPVAAVWTGRDVIFWGSTSRPGGAAGGATYNPATDRWHEIARAPLSINAGSGIWTGDEMIVFGSRLNNNNRSATPTPVGAAYSPRTDSWRKLPPIQMSPQASAIAWTGTDMIAWDYELTAFAYTPHEDQWTDIGDVPIEFSECYPANAASIQHLLAYFCGAAAVLDLSSEQWREIQAPHIYGRPVAAETVFLFAGAAHETVRNRLMAYNPR